MLSHVNPVHSHAPHSFKTHFSLNPSTPSSPKLSLSFRFSPPNPWKPTLLPFNNHEHLYQCWNISQSLYCIKEIKTFVSLLLVALQVMDSAVPGQTTDEVHSSTVCETMKHKFWDSNLTWPNSEIILCDFTRPSDTNRLGTALLKMSSRVVANASATPYGLDGPGFESLWGRNFPHPSRPANIGAGSISWG